MIPKNADLTSMKDDQLHVLNSILDSMRVQAMSVKYTKTEPTVKNVSEGQVVIYDNGAGTKRIYVVTSQGNLGYVSLT